MPKRRATAPRRPQRRVIAAPRVSRPLGWLLSAASVNAVAAGPSHNVDAVSGFTTVNTTGTNTQQVVNNFTSGGVAVNVFNHFIVGDGHTVNLELPNGAAKLVNIVRSSQPQVWGVLNAYENNKLGGDVTFASADGFLVGASGIVNVGKLTLRTPSSDDITNFVSGNKPIGDLGTGTYTLSSSGLVSIQGKVNTRDGVVVHADQVSVASGAAVIAGEAYSASYVNDAAVNTGDLSAPKTLKQSGGTIAIVAAGKSGTAVDISGQLLADGGITIEAPTIALNSGSRLDTRNQSSAVAAGAVTLSASATDKVGMGQATASTSITLDGTVVATDFSASAAAHARSSYTEDIGIWAATTSIGLLSGLNANWVQADADATVTVGSSAQLTTSGNLTLASQARALADDPAITLNGNSLVGAAVVYGKATSDSTTKVSSGAMLSVGGKLAVTAHNENTLSTSALTFVATNDNTAVVSVAVGEASSHSKALVETGASLTAGSVAVHAENQTAFYVGATAYGLSGTALGATVAYGDLTTSAVADLGASVGSNAAKVGDVEVLALDRTTEQRVHSSSTVGKSLLFRTLGAAPVAAIGAAQSFVNGVVSTVVPLNAAADLARNADGSLDFRVGAAFTLSQYDHESVAHVGNNVAAQSAPAIVSSGNVVVGARTDVREMRSTSESSVSARTTQGSGTASDPEVANSASVAINLAIGDSRATAEIGAHTDISAARIGVAAEQWQPLVSTYNRWDSFGDYLDHLTPSAGLGTSLLSGFANASGEAEENAIAYSFNLQLQDHETKAWVGSGAKLTSTATAGSWSATHTLEDLGDFADASVSFGFSGALGVHAYSQAQTIDIAGNMGALLIGAATGAGDDGSSLGASMTYVGSTNTTVAGIGSTATVNAGAGDLAVTATSDDAHIVVAPTSGVGSGTAFNGILGVFSMDNDTRASISSSAKVTAAAIDVEAHQYAGNWAAAGSFAYTDSKAIGVAIAITNSEGTTRARVGDNSDDDALVAGYTSVSTTTTGSAPTAGITTDSLTVHASTDGTSGAIAAAGAATTPKTGEPGYGQQFEDKWLALQGKLTSAFGGSTSQISSQGQGGQQNSNSGDSVTQSPDAGLGISGSLAAGITDLDTQAQVSGVTLSARSTRSAIDVQALEKTVQVSAAGSAAFIMAAKDPQASSTTAFSGAAAYMLSRNDAEATLGSVTALQAGDVNVQAAQAGQRLGIGLGFSVNTNNASGKNYSVGVSASAAQVEDSASARIENSTLDAQDGSRALEVQAYSRTDIGIGGGSLFGGGKGGVGLAVTYAEIGNGERDATEALVSGSTLTDFSSVDLKATNASRIASGAASLGGGSDALGFAGSFVINEVGGTHGATLANSTTSNVGTLKLDVRGAVDSALDTTLDNLGSGSENGTYDFSGALVSDFASPGGSFDSTGARVLGVAGLLQYGKANIGIAYTHNDLHQTHEAAITGSTVNASVVKVNAEDESWAVAVSAGVGVSTGTLSGVGSVAVNEVNNTLSARIGDWNATTASGSITSNSLSVTALNRADIAAGAGSLAVSKGSSGGLALALNLIGTSEHATSAQIGWTDLYTNGTVEVSASSGSSGDANSLMAYSVGVSLSQGGLSFAGAIGVNNVDQTVDAGLRAVSTVNGGTTYRPVSISVQATDFTENQAFGVMGAGSENGVAAAVGIGTNRIDSDVTAQVLGGRATTLYTQGLLVDASRHNDLYTFDVGVSGASGLSGAASIGTSVTDGHVLAQIASGAKVDATNSVRVSAQADTFHAVGSGAIGLGTGAAAGALGVSTAVDFGVTEALVDNAEVKALGRSGSVSVRSGRLASGPAMPDLSSAGDSVDTDALSQSFEDQSLTEGTANVTGLAVNATSAQKMRTVDIAGAGSTGAAAVAINVTTNDFEGSTTARVSNSTINSGVSGESGADVTVRASDHSFGLGISAGLAGASQGAGVAGLAMNLQTHDVAARIEGSMVKADAVTIDAAATQAAQAVSAGGAGGGTGAGAASVVVTTQYGGVKAWLLGGTTTANTVDVNAERQQESDVAAGAVAGAGKVGVGFGLAVSRIGGDTWATVGRDPDDDSSTTTTTVNAGTLGVDAARSTVINSYTFGAGIGIGAAGLAGMVNISDQAGDTRAGLYDSTLRATDGSSASSALDVSAQELYSANQHAAGVGIGLVGIGATFNVVLSSASTVAELVGSDVKAGSTTVDAQADREVGVSSVAGGAGKFAGAVSLGYIKFGAGDSGGADSELANSVATADTTVNAGYASQNSQLTAAEQTQLDAQSGGANVGSKVQNSSAADATVTGDGSTLKLPDASLLAARVSGGQLVSDSLTVNSEGRTHTYTLAGAVQGSLAGLSGGLGISRQYLVNSAIVDGSVQAASIAVSATERDGSGGAAGEIEAFTAGAGGLVIGVAYSDVIVQNRVVAGVTRAVGGDTGALNVSASDLSSVKVGGDNEDSPENVSVGLGVIGASVVRAEKNSDVDAWIGKSGSTLDGYTAMSVAAAVSGQVKATGFSVTAGVIDVTGVSANAEDNSSADAQLIGSVDTGTTAAVTVAASARPETYARAYGVAVAAGASVGGSFAYATANTSATASVADNAVFSGTGSVSVNATTGAGDSSYFSADAKALAASGGLLLGLAGTEVIASNSSKTVAKLGDRVTLPLGDLSLGAVGYSGQRADGDAYFGGILAFGKNTATAQSSTSTQVLLGADPVAGVARSGDLTLTAVGTDRNEAFATGGGGGAVSGSAADAVVKATDSDDNPAVLVQVKDWSSSHGAVGTGGLKILAEHTTQFFGGADTTAVSVIGAAAANATTTIDLDAKVQVGKYVSFESQAIDIAAANAIEQITTPSLSGWDVSVNAGAGGGINGYAAGSTINIDNQGALVSLGDHVSMDVFALSAHETLGNRLRLEAYGTLAIHDQAQISTGGAIQSASAGSTINAVANNSITLGQSVRLENEVDTVQLGTYALQNVWSTANAKTYGAVGGAAGEAVINTTVNNSVTLGGNDVLTGYGSVSVYAGRSADSITDNTVSLNAVSDVYNWTAASVSTSVSADANATVNNNIVIGSGAALQSVRNIWLQADEGRIVVSGTGRGHNPYLELLSTETKAGSATSTSSSTITFEGTATVEAGTRHEQSVTVASNGAVTKGSGTQATVYSLNSFSSRDSLQTYIDALYTEKAVTDAYVATLDADVQQTYTYSARYQEIVSQLSFLEPLLSELSASTTNAVVVAGITAAGGDVHLGADKVTVKAGTPTITAHGDPTITITNNSAQALIVDTLSIPNDAGGQVLVTGGASNSLPAALKVVEGGSGSGSQVTITHNPGVDGADLIVQGDITNLGGKVTVDVERGSMLQTASIYAKELELTVADVYLVNTSGMQTYGFSPLSLSGYVTSSRGWKPASAEEAVMWYVSDRYESQIKSKGITDFNKYFYGTDYASAYGSDATIVSNIYLNWGFNDNDECRTNCTTFSFPNNAGGDTRGNGNWGFDNVGDYTGKLTLAASYDTVKNSGFLGTAVTKDALNASLIAVNAGTIDINGTIRAGNFNNWSVNVGSNFDSAIETYIAKKGLTANDTVTITPGQPLYYTDRVWTCTILSCGYKYKQVALDTGVSLATSGDAGIGLSYDVGTGKLSLADVNASGNGMVMLRGKIVSTGQDGKILVDDGLGTIKVNNESGKELVVNDLNAGSQSTGVIRITDTNFSNRTDWYVHTPGQLIKHYITSSSATTYTGSTPLNDGWWDGGNATTSYEPKTGQWYTWTESTEVKRSYTARATNDLAMEWPTGEWKWANQDTPWTVGSGRIVSACGSCGNNYLTGVFSYGATTGYDYFHVPWSYSTYYGSTFVDRYWMYYVPYGLKMSIDYYVKADNPIKMQFIGAAQGTVAVDSNTSVALNGTISNSLGSTSLSSGGSITADASAVISSQSLSLAASGNLGSSAQALSAVTGSIKATAGGTVNLDLTAQSSSIALQAISGGSDVTITADKSLLPTGSGTHLAGRNVSVTSSFGGLGDVASNQVVNTAVTGTLTVSTRGDIALRQASGDLTLNTLTAEAGDISITLDNGRLLNGIGSSSRSAEETAYLAQVWQSLNMTGADAGQETIQAFQNQVSAKYQQYYLIKQRLSDDSSASFTISPAYMEALRTRVALLQGVSAASLSDAAVTAAVKAEYEGIQSFFTAQFGNALPFDSSAAYDSSWRYTVDPSSALYATLTSGAQWKQSQLEVAISEAALTPVTSAYISSRAANISGNNVTLKSSAGSVGKDASSLSIAISRTNPSLTDDEKAALVSAGPGDLSFSTTDTQILATVKQQDPVKVDASGVLKASTRDALYVESDQALALGTISASQGNVRLSAGGSITSSTGYATTITAAGLNLAVSQGSIGSASAPIRLNLSEALRVASAPGDIVVVQGSGSLALGSLGAGGLLSVSSGGALTNWDANGSGYHLLGDSITLAAASDLGTAERPLRMRLNGGTLTLSGNAAFIDAQSGGSWNLGSLSLGDSLDLAITGDVELTGALSATSARLVGTGQVTASAGADWNTSGSTTLAGAGVSVADARFSASQLTLQANAGSLATGELNAGDGGVTLLASGDIVLHGPLSSSGGWLADGQTLQMAAGSGASVGGSVALSTVGAMNLTYLEAGGDIGVNAGGALDVTQLLRGANVNITAAGITLEPGSLLYASQAANLDAQQLSMGSGASLRTGGPLAVTTSGDQQLTQLSADGNLSLTAGGAVSLDGSANAQGEVSVQAGSFAMAAGSALGAVGSLVLATQGDQSLAAVQAGNTLQLQAGGALALGDAVVSGQDMSLAAQGALTLAPGITVQSGASLFLQAGSLQAGAGSLLLSAGNTSIVADGDAQLAQLSVGGSLSLLAGGSVRLAEGVWVAGDAELQAQNLSIDGGLSAAGRVHVQAGQALDVNSSLSAHDLVLDVATLSIANGGVLRADNGLQINAGTLQMAAGSGIESAGDLALSAQSDLSLARISVGGSLALQAGGSLWLNDAVSAGQSISLTANSLNVEAGVGVWAGDSLWAQVGNLSAATGSQLAAGNDMQLTSSGYALLALVNVGRDLTLQSTGSTSLSDVVTVNGTAQLQADRLVVDGALTVAGWLQLQAARGVSLNSDVWGGHVNVTTGAFELNAGRGLRSARSLALDARSIVMSAGSRIEAGSTLGLTTSGDQQLAGVWSGGTATLRAGGEVSIGEQLFSNGSMGLDVGGALTIASGALVQSRSTLVADAASVSADAASRLVSSGDMQITSQGDAAFARLQSGGQLVVNAGGTVTVAESASVQGAARVQARDLVLDGGWASAGSLDLRVAQGAALNANVRAASLAVHTSALDIASGVSVVATGSTSVDAQSVHMGADSLVQSGTDLRITTTQQQSLANVIAGHDLTLQAGGDLTIARFAHANGAIALTSGGLLAVGAGATVQAGTTLSAQAGTLQADSGSSLLAGGDMSLIASGDALLARTSAGGSLLLSAGGSARATDYVNAQGMAWLQAANLQIAGGLSAQGDLEANVTQDLLLDSDLRGANVSLHAGSLAMASGVTLGTSGALWVDAGSIAMASGSLVESVQGARLNALGDAQLARLNIGGDLGVQAGGAVRLAEPVSVQGTTTLQAAALDFEGNLWSGGDLQMSATQLALHNSAYAANVTVDAGTLALGDGAALQSGGAMTVNTVSVAMGAGSALDAVAGLQVSSQGDQALARVHAGGDLVLLAGGSLSIAEQARSDAGLHALVNGAFDLAAGATMLSGGPMVLQAASVTAAGGSWIFAGGGLQLTSGGDVEVGQLGVLGNLTLQAGGAVHVSDWAQVEGDAQLRVASLTIDGPWASLGETRVHADQAVALNSRVDAGSLHVEAEGVTVASSVAVHSRSSLVADVGSIGMASGSSLEADGLMLLMTRGDQSLAALHAGGDLYVMAAGLSFNENAVADHSINLFTNGALDVAPGVTLLAGDQLGVQARSLVAGAGARLAAGSDMTITVDGAAQLALLDVGGKLALQAGGAVRVAEAAAVQGDASLNASSLTVDGGWTSQGALAVQATNGVALNSDVQAASMSLTATAVDIAAGVSVRSADALTIDAESVAMGQGSWLDAGGRLALTTTGSQDLARLSAVGDLSVAAGGTVALAEQVNAGGSMNLSAAQALAIASGIDVQAGGALTAQASSLDAGTSSRLVSGGDLRLTTVGNMQLAQLSAGGDLALQAGGAVRITESAAAKGDATLNASSLTVDGGWTSQGALTVQATNGVVLNSDVQAASMSMTATAVDIAAGVSLRSADALTIGAESVAMGQGSQLNAGGRIALTTTGSQDLARLSAGGDLSLAAGGPLALNEQVQAGGAMSLSSAQALTIASGIDVQAGDALTAQANSLDAGTSSRLVSGGDLRLTTVGNMQLAQLDAGGTLALQAGGAVRVAEAAAVQGDASVNASSLTVDGGWTSQGALTVQATNGVALNSDVQAASMSMTATGVDIAAGVSVRSADALTIDAKSVAMGQGSQLDAGGRLALTTTGGLIAGAASQLASGGDMQLSAGGDMLLAQVSTGGDLALQAGGAVRVAQAAAVQGDGSVNASSLTVDGGWTSQGALTVQVTNSVALNSDVQAASMSMTATAVDIAAGVSVRSADALTIDAESVAMGQGSWLDAGGRLALTTTGGLIAGAASQLASGGDMQLSAGGDMLLAQVSTGGDLTLQAAGGAVRVVEAAAVQGDATLSASSLTIDGGWTSQGALTVQATNDVALNSDVQAASMSMTATGVDIAAGVSVRSADALTIDAKSVAMGQGSQLDAGGRLALTTTGGLIAGAASQLASGGDMQLSAGGDMLLAQVSTGGDLALQAGGAVRVAEAATVQGDASLKASSLSVDGGWTSQGALTVQATNSVALNSDVQAAASMSMTATAVDIAAGVSVHSADALTIDAESVAMGQGSWLDAGGRLALTTTGSQDLARLSAGGDLSVAAGGSLALNEQVQAGGAMSLSSAQALTIASGIDVQAGGALTAQASSLDAGTSSRLVSGGDLQLTTVGNMQLAQLSAGGNLALQAGGAVRITESAAAQGDATLTASSLTVDGGWTSQGALTVQATNGVVLNSDVQAASMSMTATAVDIAAGVSVRSADALTIDAESVATGQGSQLDAGGRLALTTTGSQDLARLSAGGDLSLAAGGPLALNEQVQAGGAMSLSSAQALTIASGIDVQAGGALTAQASSLSAGESSRLVSGGDMQLATGGDMSLARLQVGGDLAVDAGSSLLMTQDVDSTGSIALRSGGTTQLADGRSLLAGAAFSAEAAADWQMGAGSRLQAEGDLRLQAGGDVLLAAVTGHGDLLSVKAGGALAGRTDTAVHIATDQAPTHVELQAGLGLGNPLVVDAPWLSVATSSGDINLVVERDVYSPLISAENGNVTMVVHGSLTFDHLLGNPNLWVDGRLSGTQLTLHQGTLASRDEVQITQLMLPGGGPLTVQAPRISLQIDAEGAAVTTLSLTGFEGARAENVALGVTGTQKVDILTLSTRDGQMVLPADVALREASASGALTISTPVVTLSLDNVNPAARPADAQLMTPDDQFWLQLQGNALFTDALVTRFQSPLALYFHRADEDKLVAQQAFYRMSTEHLSQEVAGSSWRIPAQLQPLFSGSTVSFLGGTGVPAVGLKGAPPLHAAGRAADGEAEDDIVIGEPVAQ